MKDGSSEEVAALASELEGLEQQLTVIRRKLVRIISERSAPAPNSAAAAIPNETSPKAVESNAGDVGAADAVRIALFLSGGRADRANLTPATQGLTPSRTKTKGISIPASLVNSGEIHRQRGAAKGHTIFEISDALKTLRILKKHPPSYKLFKDQLLKGPDRAEQVSAALLQSYGRRARSFLISDFLRAVETIADKEIRVAVERSLPRLIAALVTKRTIELTEDQEGLLVSGKPVSKVIWLGGP